MKKDYKKILQDDFSIPKNLSDRIARTLEILPEKMPEKKRIRRNWKSFAAAIMAVLLVGGGGYAAAQKLFYPKMAEHFHVDETQQAELLDKEIAKELNISSEQNGITITAKQAVADGFFLYAALEVRGESIRKVREKLGENVDYHFNGNLGEAKQSFFFIEGVATNLQASVEEDEKDFGKLYLTISHNNKYYPENPENTQDWENKQAEFSVVSIECINENGEKILLEGPWKMTIPLNYHKINQKEIAFKEKITPEFTLEKAFITPLGFVPYWRISEKIELTEREKQYGIDLPSLMGFIYKDGSFHSFGQGGGRSYMPNPPFSDLPEEKGTFILKECFAYDRQILDVTQVKAIVFCPPFKQLAEKWGFKVDTIENDVLKMDHIDQKWGEIKKLSVEDMFKEMDAKIIELD